MDPSSTKSQLLPYPDPSMGKNCVERTGDEAFPLRAAHYRPKDASEPPAATASRVAMRLVTASGNGKTYEDLVTDFGGVVPTTSNTAYVMINGAWYAAVYDGAPTAGNDAVAASGTAGGVTWTNKTAGLAGNSVKLNILDPGPSNATLSFAVSGVNINVTPKTTAGNAATATILTDGTDTLVVTAVPDTGETNVDCNDRTAVVAEGESGGTLSAAYAGGVLTVTLAMDTGTAAEWTITDAGTGADSLITITGPSGSGIDPTDYDNVSFESIVPSDTSQSLTIVTTGYPLIRISLPTDTNGDVIATSASDIATALGSASGNGFTGSDWTFTPAVADGDWDSYNEPQGASTPAVAIAPLTDGSNQTTAVAAAIHALPLFNCTATGTDEVVPNENPYPDYAFSGGGASHAADSTAAQIAALTNFPLTAGGTTSNKPSIGNDIVTFSGGLDNVTGTIGWLGRIAIDEDRVWTCMAENMDGENPSAWVKTFDATP